MGNRKRLNAAGPSRGGRVTFFFGTGNGLTVAVKFTSTLVATLKRTVLARTTTVAGWVCAWRETRMVSLMRTRGVRMRETIRDPPQHFWSGNRARSRPSSAPPSPRSWRPTARGPCQPTPCPVGAGPVDRRALRQERVIQGHQRQRGRAPPAPANRPTQAGRHVPAEPACPGLPGLHDDAARCVRGGSRYLPPGDSFFPLPLCDSFFPLPLSREGGIPAHWCLPRHGRLPLRLSS